MKILSIFFLLVLTLNEDSYKVKTCQYKGFIFSENKQVFLSIDEQKNRYTPSETDINYAETILRNKIKTVDNGGLNQGPGCPKIQKNLKKYTRQYVGFINKKGEKIIWINFIWRKGFEESISNEIVTVLDGCSYYWDIKINITTGEIFDFSVNGLA